MVGLVLGLFDHGQRQATGIFVTKKCDFSGLVILQNWRWMASGRPLQFLLFSVQDCVQQRDEAALFVDDRLLV